MAYQVRSADMQTMTGAERDKALGELVRAASSRRNGQAAEIDARIRRFEVRYEMTSEELLRRLSKGEERETAEIADWLFWLGVRGDCGEPIQARS